MKLQPQGLIPLSTVTFFSIILVGAMGWIVALNQLQAHPGEITKELIAIGDEVLRVVVIAAAAAIAVERFLKSKAEPEEDYLGKVGIKRIFSRRQDAAEEFLRCVRDQNVRRVTLCGISLRDFLPNGGTLHEVWRTLCERLRQEQLSNLPHNQRLHIRLLLLLPNSDEGYFRHAVEGGNQRNLVGIPFDIPHGLNSIRTAQTEIFGKLDVEFVQVRLYEHCPFAFMLATEFATQSHVFVEQYDYRDQKRPAAMPLINYESGTSQYEELMFSLGVIWDNACQTELLEEAGTAPAIREAQIKNIFRGEQRALLTKRQIGAIQRASGESIDILVISGKFYTSNPNVARELQRVSRPDGPSPRVPVVPVRFALINPVSQQAILRAVAEGCHPEEVGEQLRNWNWALHQQSNLYTDARNTAHTLVTWNEQRGCQISVRLYSSAVACMLLKTDSHVFIEQYMYGRSKAFQPGFNLGGEYPVIEYELSETNDGAEMVEHQIISATFEMIWKFYSTSWEAYLKLNHHKEFEANLAQLRTELVVM
jgi:hypothetical protein